MDVLVRAIESLIDKKLDAYTVNFNAKTLPFIAGFTTELTLEVIKAEKKTGGTFTKSSIGEIFALMTKLNNFNPRDVVPMYVDGERA